MKLPKEGFVRVDLSVEIPVAYTIQQVATFSTDAFGVVAADSTVIGEIDRVAAAAQLRFLADLMELGNLDDDHEEES